MGCSKEKNVTLEETNANDPQVPQAETSLHSLSKVFESEVATCFMWTLFERNPEINGTHEKRRS